MIDARPEAVIVDMDGTLTDVSGIRHHVRRFNEDGTKNRHRNFDAFHAESINCPPHQQALNFMARHENLGRLNIIVTGRMITWFGVSSLWLAREVVPLVNFIGPFMRPDKDYRSDVEIKREIFHRDIEPYFHVVAACDDNPAIIALWEELGIPVEIVEGWDHEEIRA